MNTLEQQVDKVLAKVINMDEKVDRLEVDVADIKEIQEMTYRRIDGFINMVDRHEAEIAALRAGLERVEQRLSLLEAQKA